MRTFIIVSLLTAALSVSAKQELMVKVLTLNDRARLCPNPDCSQDSEIARIKTNSILSVTTTKTVKKGFMKAKWHKVTYDGQTGWISEYNIKVVK